MTWIAAYFQWKPTQVLPREMLDIVIERMKGHGSTFQRWHEVQGSVDIYGVSEPAEPKEEIQVSEDLILRIPSREVLDLKQQLERHELELYGEVKVNRLFGVINTVYLTAEQAKTLIVSLAGASDAAAGRYASWRAEREAEAMALLETEIAERAAAKEFFKTLMKGTHWKSPKGYLYTIATVFEKTEMVTVKWETGPHQGEKEKVQSRALLGSEASLPPPKTPRKKTKSGVNAE